MANNPFDRTPVHPLERMLSSDINQGESQADYAVRFALQHLLAQNAGFAPGFLGAAYKVVPNSPAGMSVLVSPGLGLASDPADVPTAIGGLVGLDDRCAVKPMVLLSPALFTVPANGSGNPRVDIIEAKIDRRLENPSSRLVFNASTQAFDPGTVSKTLAFNHDGRLGTVATPANSTAGLSYKTGTPAGSPVAPAVTSGYTKIAEIQVASGAASITAAQIADRRAILGPGGGISAARRFRHQWNAGAPIVTLISDVINPGIDLVFSASNVNRASGILIAVGGQIADGILNVSMMANSVSASQLAVAMITSADIVDVDSSYQTLLLGFGISVAIGAKIFVCTIEGRHQDGATTSITNVDLEDVTWNVNVRLGY